MRFIDSLCPVDMSPSEVTSLLRTITWPVLQADIRLNMFLGQRREVGSECNARTKKTCKTFDGVALGQGENDSLSSKSRNICS